jgi:two-component system chemotaxis response regulator CheB
MTRPIRVLIVDDSALVRQALSRVLSDADDISVMATAADPFQAAAKLKTEAPDVILLDIEMPRMDGVTFLRRLMRQHPIPTIICSSLAESGSVTTLAALEAGAVDIIQKPALTTREFFEDASARIHDAVRGAAAARVRARDSVRPVAFPVDKGHKDGEPLRAAPMRTTDKVVVVGASTGGTEAIRILLEGCGVDTPAIAIVQHMPPGFTAGFARRLDQVCRLRVKEAQTGDALVAGQALIAPGDRHMTVHRSGARYHVEISDGPPVNRHRPSVDVLFHSTAEAVGPNAVGVILTGMGDDGARGLLAMKDAGAETLGQDEASCVVYGMPREAARMGAVHRVLPLDAMSEAVLEASGHAARY